MKDTYIGIFDTPEDAQAAADALYQNGYEQVLAVEGNLPLRDKGTIIADSVVAGAILGGLVGAVLGLLVGLGILTFPGVTTLFFGAPVSLALGLTGAMGTLVSGAVSGIIVGGVIGAVIGFATPESAYTDQMFVIVPSQAGSEEEVIALMEDNNVLEIRSVPSPEAAYRLLGQASPYSYPLRTASLGVKGGRSRVKKKTTRHTKSSRKVRT